MGSVLLCLVLLASLRSLYMPLVHRLIRWWKAKSGGEPVDPKTLPYRAFTTDFDRVVSIGELDEAIGPLSHKAKTSLDEAWTIFSEELSGWRTKLHLAALAASARIRDKISPDCLAGTVVAILIDHSGSMRGQGILLAAASADVAQNFLGLLGCTVEVLGFTTASWKGGRSRRLWNCALRPPHPGRLCDLLHIIYKARRSVGSGAGRGEFKRMLRADLLKENVDGEAIEWATGRLRSYPESHKILLVISDGAPVDDSTLMANHKDILDRHLRSVVHSLEQSKDVTIAAIGIGFDVSRYYTKATTVKTADDLGSALLATLEQLILERSTMGAAGVVPS